VLAPGDKITVFAMHNFRETVPLTVGRLDLATVRVSAGPQEVQ
jgi:hypothetical protein